MEKEGVEEQFPKVVGKTHYEKLSNALDRRELRDFGSTKGSIRQNFGVLFEGSVGWLGEEWKLNFSRPVFHK